MAAALAMGLPAKLSKCASFLGVAEQKDTAGAKVMRVLCQPDESGKIPKGTPAQLATLYAYCEQDTATEEAIAASIRPLQSLERPVWLLDQAVNDYGILVDRPLARAAQRLWRTYSDTLVDEYQAIMGDEEVAPSMVARLKTWVQAEMGLPKPLDSLNESCVAELLSQVIPANVRRALEIRQLLAGAAVKKFARFESMSHNPDSRIRGALFYHGASTGRWTGKSVQVQNLMRPTLEAEHVPFVRQLILSQDIAGIEMYFNSVSDTLGSMCRATIIAPLGKSLIVVDYSNIEARISAYLAGQENLLGDFRAKRDPYISMAATIFSKPPQAVTKAERYIGKSTILGASYSMGPVKFRESVKQTVEITEEFATKCISTYREQYSDITMLWGVLQSRVVRAIQTQQHTVINKYLTAYMDGGWLILTLPSGRYLSYYKPTLAPGKFSQPEINFIGVDPQSNNPRKEKLYGGKLLENITQAVARDVMAISMGALTAAGYQIIMTVHDELIIEGWPSDLSNIEHLMRTAPPWAPGLPIEVEGYYSEFYFK
jgi:DNA polymerase